MKIWRLLLVVGGLALLGWIGFGAGSISCVQGQLCLPLPDETPPSPHPPQAFLPLVLSGDAEETPQGRACDVDEQEYNDVHTLAQPIDHCVNGQATTDLDMDWYQLEACQGPIDISLVLDGENDVDLYIYGDPPGEPLAKSESWTGQEALELTNLITGTYYALIQPALGARGMYTLTVEAAWSD
jgi:hypothetical protein